MKEFSDKVLVDHDSPLPTRKVGAASAAAALVGAIVAAVVGILPGGGEELRDAITVLIDAAVGGGLTGLVTLISGYFVRDAVTIHDEEDMIPDDIDREDLVP